MCIAFDIVSGVFSSVCFYEKKRKIFSVGYLFILINVFIDGVLCPGYFTDSRLREMEREGVQEPQDFFLLYVGVYFIIMAVILLYLLCETDDR